MKKTILVLLLAILALSLFACGAEDENGYTAEPLATAQPTPEPTPEPTPPEEPEPTPEPTPEPVPEPTPEPTIPPEDYGRLVAEEFISTLTTIFTGIVRAETAWDEDINAPVTTGQFILSWGWDENGVWYANTTDEVPDFYFGPIETGRYEWGFIDRHGNRVLYGVPWLYTQRFEHYTLEGELRISYSQNYANYFLLFDFDNNGIPVIFVHFNQTFDGGYGGFYRVFRYVDGEYRMLETKAFVDGVEHPEPWRAWLGSMHEFFIDDTGRIIAFIHSEYHGVSQYEHLVLTDEHAELHLITALDFNNDWEAWQQHHWVDWSTGVRADCWTLHNPTIFGTDISLAPAQPLVDLQEEITASIMGRLFPN